jgi:[methyl-Co(III) methanol-specific corrinoid protein]:coenzyme M methyltransferase
MREEILSLLAGRKTDKVPAFSGLIHVTAEGLNREGLRLPEVHHDARKMAKAAASSFRLTGIPSAALPLDLCAPAEALGATLNYYENSDHLFPQPASFISSSTRYISQAFLDRADFVHKGRLDLIDEAFRLLKEEVGNDIVISGIIPGPYTLLLYLIESGSLFAEMKREPNAVRDALFQLASFLSECGSAYRDAGADFITIHEMGGSPGFIGPTMFEQFVFPSVQQLISRLPSPIVLSVCGNTNRAIGLLARTGADAISVDQTNDLVLSRAMLSGTLLFGNLDPVATLQHGDEAAVTEAVRAAKEAGVDAVWPGCDLAVETPIRNIQSLLDATGFSG